VRKNGEEQKEKKSPKKIFKKKEWRGACIPCLEVNKKTGMRPPNLRIKRQNKMSRTPR
jgi:hypothetical protein